MKDAVGFVIVLVFCIIGHKFSILSVLEIIGVLIAAGGGWFIWQIHQQLETPTDHSWGYTTPVDTVAIAEKRAKREVQEKQVQIRKQAAMHEMMHQEALKERERRLRRKRELAALDAELSKY